MKQRRLLSLVGSVVCITCGGSEPVPQNAEVSNTPSSRALAQKADRLLADSFRPDYRRPMYATPVDFATIGEHYLFACRAGDKRSCWMATEIRDPQGLAAANVRDNCRAGDLLSCRALPPDTTDAVRKDLPGWQGRSRACQLEGCPRAVLEEECRAGFPWSCHELISLDEPAVESRPLGYKPAPAVVAPLLQLARRGCQADILSECSLLVARAPHTPGAVSDDVLLGCERMCAIAAYHCSFLGTSYRHAGQPEKAQQAFEHDCQFGGACEVAISGYLDFHMPEPVPHRGLDLANWACQHGEFCRPEVAPAQRAGNRTYESYKPVPAPN